jgi:hypothetical protein
LDVENCGFGPVFIDEFIAYGLVSTHPIKKDQHLSLPRLLHIVQWKRTVIRKRFEDIVLKPGEMKQITLGQTFEAFFAKKQGVLFIIKYRDFRGLKYKHICRWEKDRWERVSK